MVLALMITVAFLAAANGANDTFKGVAPLWGGGSWSYRRALAWGTLTTLMGSLLSLSMGSALAVRFTGKGVVPDALVGEMQGRTAMRDLPHFEARMRDMTPTAGAGLWEWYCEEVSKDL